MPESYLQADLKGVNESIKVMRKLPKGMRRNVLRTAARAAGNVMKKEAMAKAPRSTVDRSTKFAHEKKGFYKKHLEEQIKVSTTDRGANFVEVAVHVGSAFWGKFKEFGTSKMAAEPWFRPAFDNSQPRMLQKLVQALGSGMVRQANKFAKGLIKVKK